MEWGLGNGNETIITAPSCTYLSAHGGRQAVVESHYSVLPHHLYRHAIEPHLGLLLCLEEDLEERKGSS